MQNSKRENGLLRFKASVGVFSSSGRALVIFEKNGRYKRCEV